MASHKESLSELQGALFALCYESSFNVKTGAFIPKLTCHTRITGCAAKVELIRDAALVANKGPWTNGDENITFVEIKTNCCAGHNLKKIDSAALNGRGARGGIGCDVCGERVGRKDDYYNCG
jgi:hypothetical protein